MIDLISKYRNVLMGWATLFIILGHTIFYGSNYVYYGPILHQIIRYGCIGVDMFLFLSGFGLVYSIKKHPVAVFYKNRISRLLPSLIMLALFICAWSIVIGSPASICNIYIKFTRESLITIWTN